MATPVLSVTDLVVEFSTEQGTLRAVDQVAFEIMPGEILGVVGESGSGKSVSALAVMGLVRPPGRVTSGEARFQGKDLLSMTQSELRRLRGRDMSLVFQDPMASLNPVMTVGRQIDEALRIHRFEGTAEQRKARVLQLLELVGIPDPQHRYRQHPHEFSGGMRQRAMIAMAIANDPVLLLADEPTTALDVTIQAQVLDVLQDVVRRTSSAMMFITHDLGVVSEIADRVAVMYSGRIVETGTVAEIFGSPKHPYTLGLMASLPRLTSDAKELVSIPGQPPDPLVRPSGCNFRPRCVVSDERERCRVEVPELRDIDPGHRAACHFAEEIDQEIERVTEQMGIDVVGSSP